MTLISLAKMTPQCAQMCYCRPPGRRIVGSLLHFSPTLFLNDPTVILPHFLMLADQGAGKKPARKHLNPFWWHIVKKQPSKTHLGEKITKNRHQLRSKWTPWPRTQLPYFSLAAPLCDTWAPRSQKTGSRHTNLPKSMTNGPP